MSLCIFPKGLTKVRALNKQKINRIKRTINHHKIICNYKDYNQKFMDAIKRIIAIHYPKIKKKNLDRVKK